MIKKVLIFILVIFVVFITGCSETSKTSDITINTTSNTFIVNDTFALNGYVERSSVYYESSDSEVIIINGYMGYAKSCGEALIYAYSRTDKSLVKKYFVSVVSNSIQSIDLSGTTIMYTGQTQTLECICEPAQSMGDVHYLSEDESVATVDQNGVVTAVDKGIVTVRAYSINNTAISDEIEICVLKKNGSNEIIINTNTENNKTINASGLTELLYPIIDKTRQSVIGVNGYYKNNRIGTESLITSATGVIYKRFCVLASGVEVIDDGTITNFVGYKYYVITNKHVVEDMSSVKVYEDPLELDAVVIAYDSKIDIALISFTTDRYYQTATFSDSDQCDNGEFVLAVGISYGGQYYKGASLGVISYNNRYVATDTDNDDVNDWDALYIQHDAAISESSSGSPLVNMKGEVIAINSVKISADTIDNMAFAIPVNTVLDLVEILETGVCQTRPLLGVTIRSIKDILKSTSLQAEYNIPEEVTYGMYVTSITEGGVAHASNVQIGDIILDFNGVSIYYSYEIRAALNECIIGSNEEIVIHVYRNGKIVELKAVF